MAITSMVRIFASIAMIIFAGAVTVSATGAFFSDSETSTGNQFEAGSINLAIGSTFSSEANGGPQEVEMIDDNAGRSLYAFSDLKPGDFGQGSFQLSVSSNEAFLCARSTVDSMPENDLIEAEAEAGDVTVDPDGGELQNYLRFGIFNDADGNGVLDVGEPFNIAQPENFPEGEGTGFTAEQIAAVGWIAAADPSASDTWLIESSLIPGETYNAGFMYCFGNFESDGSCAMSGNDENDSQSDGLSGSIEFQAIQTRNNDGFMCSSLNAPEDPEIG